MWVYKEKHALLTWTLYVEKVTFQIYKEKVLGCKGHGQIVRIIIFENTTLAFVFFAHLMRKNGVVIDR